MMSFTTALSCNWMEVGYLSNGICKSIYSCVAKIEKEGSKINRAKAETIIIPGRKLLLLLFSFFAFNALLLPVSWLVLTCYLFFG